MIAEPSQDSDVYAPSGNHRPSQAFPGALALSMHARSQLGSRRHKYPPEFAMLNTIHSSLARQVRFPVQAVQEISEIDHALLRSEIRRCQKLLRSAPNKAIP
ncbi:unnamed protein product, partial [Mycena citricolor]